MTVPSSHGFLRAKLHLCKWMSFVIRPRQRPLHSDKTIDPLHRRRPVTYESLYGLAGIEWNPESHVHGDTKCPWVCGSFEAALGTHQSGWRHDGGVTQRRVSRACMVMQQSTVQIGSSQCKSQKPCSVTVYIIHIQLFSLPAVFTMNTSCNLSKFQLFVATKSLSMQSRCMHPILREPASVRQTFQTLTPTKENVVYGRMLIWFPKMQRMTQCRKALLDAFRTLNRIHCEPASNNFVLWCNSARHSFSVSTRTRVFRTFLGKSGSRFRSGIRLSPKGTQCQHSRNKVLVEMEFRLKVFEEGGNQTWECQGSAHAVCYPHSSLLVNMNFVVVVWSVYHTMETEVQRTVPCCCVWQPELHIQWICTRLYQNIVSLCVFRKEVTSPVCTQKDKGIGWSDIVWNQPPVPIAKHAEHAGCLR